MKRIALVLTGASLLFASQVFAKDQAPPAQYQNLLTPLLQGGRTCSVRHSGIRPERRT